MTANHDRDHSDAGSSGVLGDIEPKNDGRDGSCDCGGCRDGCSCSGVEDGDVVGMFVSRSADALVVSSSVAAVGRFVSGGVDLTVRVGGEVAVHVEDGLICQSVETADGLECDVFDGVCVSVQDRFVEQAAYFECRGVVDSCRVLIDVDDVSGDVSKVDLNTFRGVGPEEVEISVGGSSGSDDVDSDCSGSDAEECNRMFSIRQTDADRVFPKPMPVFHSHAVESGSSGSGSGSGSGDASSTPDVSGDDGDLRRRSISK